MNLPSYVMITPARNEAEFIERTIKSMISQSVPPLKWVIVSDGSTDGTDEIVTKYAADYPWIELLRMPERTERHFAGKVNAFNAGYARVKDLPYDAIGSMDGDISFDDTYFPYLLQKMAEDPTLGLVGTPFRGESTPAYDYRYVSIEHVSGACQLFRRKCFEEIGGYVAVKGGGVDHIAVISCRMRGWKTRTFTDKVILHHREMGSAEAGTLKIRYKTGALDYALGSHPLWEVSRTIHQMRRKPYIIGGLLLFCGYMWSAIRRVKRPVSAELVKFRHREQMERLKKFVKRDRVPPPSHVEVSS